MQTGREMGFELGHRGRDIFVRHPLVIRGDELRDAFDDLGSSVGRRTEAREIGRWFVVGGLVVAGLAALGSIRWFARIP